MIVSAVMIQIGIAVTIVTIATRTVRTVTIRVMIAIIVIIVVIVGSPSLWARRGGDLQAVRHRTPTLGI